METKMDKEQHKRMNKIMKINSKYPVKAFTKMDMETETLKDKLYFNRDGIWYKEEDLAQKIKELKDLWNDCDNKAEFPMHNILDNEIFGKFEQ